MWCYSLEANSIQGWILAGGKMRDVAGASQLLDRLCNWPEESSDAVPDLVARVMAALALTDDKLRFSRRAGGALIAFGGKDDLVRFRSAFAIAVKAAAPGLPFVDGLAEGVNARQAYTNCRAQLLISKNVPTFDPINAGPFHRLAQRTGRPAILKPKHISGVKVDKDGAASNGELLDEGQWAKRAEIVHRDVNSQLDRKFLSAVDVRCAVELNRDAETKYPCMPFDNDNQYIGLMHADGNGLGETLSALTKALEGANDELFIDVYRDFSKALATATERAAKHATESLPVYHDKTAGCDVLPLRPILLGGDDLTVILRGDVAIEFTKEFLAAFAEETAEEFKKLRSAHGLDEQTIPNGFSAGAGIAFVKAKQPFAQAYELCETLAKHAKTQAKRSVESGVPPSLLAFHRVSTSHIHENYDDVRREELELNGRRLGMGAYAVSDCAVFPSITDLQNLRDTIELSGASKGVLREAVGDTDKAIEQKRIKRGLSVLKKRDPDSFDQLQGILAALGCPEGSLYAQSAEYGFNGDFHKTEATPVFDALSLIAVEAEVQHQDGGKADAA